MTYQIKTPMLAESAEIALTCAKAVMSGALEPKLANSAISGARAVQSAVRVDVTTRLAAPKIAFLEAKKVEGDVDVERQQQIEQSKAA